MAFAASIRRSNSLGWKFGPIAMVGPASIFTASAGDSPGCMPNVTSRATATSGAMPKAPVIAPRLPTSSCTVATAYTSQAWRRRESSSRQSTMAAIEARSSMDLHAAYPPESSVHRARNVTRSPTWTRESTSWGRRPTSMKSFSRATGFSRSDGIREVRRNAHDDPGKLARPPWTITSWAKRTHGSKPPTGATRRKPFSTWETMRAISSMCPVSMRAGRAPFEGAPTGRGVVRAGHARDAVAQGVDANVARVCGETGADDLPHLLLVTGGTTRFRELLEEGRGFHGTKIPARSVLVQPARAGPRGRRLRPKHARIRTPPRGTAAKETKRATYPCASRMYPAVTLARNDARPVPIAL